MQASQRVCEAEPAHEQFLRAPPGAKASAYGLAVELHVKLHTQRAIFVGTSFVIHLVDRMLGVSAPASGSSLISSPEPSLDEAV